MSIAASGRFLDYLADIPKLHSWDNGATWNTDGFGRHHFEPLAAPLRRSFRSRPDTLKQARATRRSSFCYRTQLASSLLRLTLPCSTASMLLLRTRHLRNAA
jgi:hypothetical protein